MGAAGFGGSFVPTVQYEKWEIHKVFPHFSYFRLRQNLSPNLLAPLCGAALNCEGSYVLNILYMTHCDSIVSDMIYGHSPSLEVMQPRIRWRFPGQ